MEGLYPHSSVSLNKPINSGNNYSIISVESSNFAHGSLTKEDHASYYSGIYIYRTSFGK